VHRAERVLGPARMLAVVGSSCVEVRLPTHRRWQVEDPEQRGLLEWARSSWRHVLEMVFEDMAAAAVVVAALGLHRQAVVGKKCPFDASFH